MRAADRQLAERLRHLPVGERSRVLRGFLRERISDALGIESSEVSFRDRLMDLGVNSMKAVELKLALEHELELSLSSSLLFDYPTIESLTAFFLEQMDDAPRRPPRDREPEPLAAGVAGASLDTVCPGRASLDGASRIVAELLAEELADLQARHGRCS